MAGPVLLSDKCKMLMIIIYLSINYTDKQKSPLVFLLLGSCQEAIFSHRVCRGFSGAVSYWFFFFLFPSEDHICCFMQEIPAVLEFPGSSWKDIRVSKAEPARALSMLQAADVCCFLSLCVSHSLA